MYVNFLGDEGEARVRDAYPGATWDRLAGFKARYDPTNLFRRNQNIPAAVESDSVKPNDYKEPARAGDAGEESTIYETAEDLSELSELFDHSYARAGAHLRSLFTPVRRIPAADLAALLPGVQVLNLATVSRACAPRVAPVDGLLYRGRFWVGAAAASLRFSHLRERPQLSASHTRGEALAVIVHGTAALFEYGRSRSRWVRRLLRGRRLWLERMGPPRPRRPHRPEQPLHLSDRSRRRRRLRRARSASSTPRKVSQSSCSIPGEIDVTNRSRRMEHHGETKPKIARVWRGRTARDRADEYLRYWRQEGGLHPLAEKALAVQMLREDRGGETEFVTISWWPTIEAMSAFAGDDPMRVHHLPRDPEFLLELPERVQVLELTDATWPPVVQR